MGRHLWNEAAKRWVWRCDHCGTTELWSDSWLWYGSLLDAETTGKILAACGEPCMKALVASKRVPEDARLIEDTGAGRIGKRAIR